MTALFAWTRTRWLRYKRDRAYSLMFRLAPNALRWNGRRRDD